MLHDEQYSTQSYTGYEPTSMRAIRARYNPYLQTRNRIDQLRMLGHPVDKVEFIIMGGTFMSLDAEYRDYFVRNLHDALSGHTSNNVQEAVAYSEQSNTKCIGITIETRPDYCLKPHLSNMLVYGCTRYRRAHPVELARGAEDGGRATSDAHMVVDWSGWRLVCSRSTRTLLVIPTGTSTPPPSISARWHGCSLPTLTQTHTLSYYRLGG